MFWTREGEGIGGTVRWGFLMVVFAADVAGGGRDVWCCLCGGRGEESERGDEEHQERLFEGLRMVVLLSGLKRRPWWQAFGVMITDYAEYVMSITLLELETDLRESTGSELNILKGIRRDDCNERGRRRMK